MTEDEMVGWHHRLDGHEFEQAPRVGDGQGGLACCSPWGRKAASGQQPKAGHTQQHRDSSPKLVTPSSIGTAARNRSHPAASGQQHETGHT